MQWPMVKGTFLLRVDYFLSVSMLSDIFALTIARIYEPFVPALMTLASYLVDNTFSMDYFFPFAFGVFMSFRYRRPSSISFDISMVVCRLIWHRCVPDLSHHHFLCRHFLRLRTSCVLFLDFESLFISFRVHFLAFHHTY